MFELSETELYILEELWNLIQTRRTIQGVPSEDFGSKTSSTLPQQIDDPLIEGRMRSLHRRFTDRT